jgi:DNA segregation ATPase FtsK/SpoIIIE, S-DNA-T family
MALEVSSTQPVPDADVIDVDEVTRTEQMRGKARELAARHQAKARKALDEQRVRVAARVRDWFRTTDVTDAQLADEIERKRRRDQDQGERELRSRVQALREQLRAADEKTAPVLSAQLTAAQAQIQLRRDEDADRMKVSGRDLIKARWMKKATRIGALGAGSLAYVNGVAAEPMLALASLGAAPLAWFYLGREFAADEKPAAVIPGQGVGPDGTLVANAAVPGTSFVPDALAAMGRVSLVKPESGRVQGEKDLVTALIKAGIITAAQRDETHLAGVIQPSGPGWTATVDLPRGVKASAAVSRVEDLASALRIKKSRIEISADTSDDGHEGRFVLWVANEDNPYGSEKHMSELIGADRWDFWQQGVPLGADARRERHTMHLLWSSLLIGGLMGYGKSYMARLVAAAAALDPTVRVIVVTGKTGPDWAPLRHIAHQWIAGATPDIIRRVLGVMEQTIGEMQDRGTELDRLYEEDPDSVPEGKITPELAQKGMGPVLLVVDELQELLDGAALVQVAIEDEPEGGGRAKARSGRDLMVEAFARYVRVTRFVGGMGVFITQRPDADSVPTKLREVCAKRASYRVKGDRSSKMVLGDDAVANGAAPHLLGDASKGVVVLDQGGEQGHATLKADVIDLPDFREICLRGRQLRIDAGTLTGDAFEYGKEDAAAAAAAALLADCLAALDSASLDRARTERLLELLAEHAPDRYRETTKAQLQARLREAGAGTTKKIGAVDGMANANGYTREQIAAAVKTGK